MVLNYGPQKLLKSRYGPSLKKVGRPCFKPFPAMFCFTLAINFCLPTSFESTRIEIFQLAVVVAAKRLGLLNSN